MRAAARRAGGMTGLEVGACHAHTISQGRRQWPGSGQSSDVEYREVDGDRGGSPGHVMRRRDRGWLEELASGSETRTGPGHKAQRVSEGMPSQPGNLRWLGYWPWGLLS